MPTTVGQRLEMALDDKGIKAAELCRRVRSQHGLKLSDSQVGRLINGNREGLAYPVLQAIADVLDVEVRWLWFDEGERLRRPHPGRLALDRAFEIVSWPAPVVVEAADAAAARARAEANEPAGRDRVVSVWVARLLQLYAEALAMPESLATTSSAPQSAAQPSAAPPPEDGSSRTQPRRSRRPS